MTGLLEMRGVTFTYEGSGRPSLSDVSLTVSKGSKTAILGANGAGKSTLFYHFNGVCRPDSGQVLFMGEPVSYRRKALKELRSHVAVVLQNPDDQIFGQTVEADARYGPSNLGLSDKEVAERAEEALRQVGLWELRERNSLQLSYGQRKRLSLAGALAMRPDVLIMDEPTAGLDPRMALELMELAEQLHDGGTDIVMSTHDVDLAYMWADEIHVLSGGRCVYSGDQEGFYSQPSLVGSSGLLQPSMFQVNAGLSASNGVAESPYPRTEAQLAAKTIVGPRGRIKIVPVADVGPDFRAENLGVCGTESRRKVRELDLPVDYPFGGLDSCLRQAVLGMDAVLICDEDRIGPVTSKIEDMSRFGRPIEIVR